MRLNKELMKKNKELEQVLYATSHDLRSPLVNIQGFAKELQASLQDLTSIINRKEFPDSLWNKCEPILSDDVPESLDFILSSASKMDGLLSGLLTLSRVGRQKLTIRNLNMDTILADVISIFEYRIKEKDITIVTSELPNCRGDEVQINQLFSNLVGNAVKFIDSKRKPVITISGKKDKDNAVYSVKDNGIGISSNHQDKIFNLFHQLDPHIPGTGIGLAIVKQILNKHNGKIKIDSHPGKGTCFEISLPLAN
jgi:signal transduction histidine kinase